MVNKLFKNRYFFTVFQFLTLIVFILLIYGSIGVTTNDPDFAKTLRNTNLANLIVWSYWWPLIIVSAILFGRYWCSICPVELITSFFGKIGLQKKPGKFLRSGWIITLFYAIIIILGLHTFAIHRIPQYMAIYMLILFVVAIITGLIWEKRTFCTYVCPIGHLLGLYSLLSFSKLRVKDSKVCETCETKDCISKGNHYKFVGRSCTSELYPPKITDNRSCIMCGQCFKSCSKDNIIINKRSVASDLFKNINLRWSEIVFFMIVSFFVIYEVLSEWSVTKNFLLTIPHWVNNNLDLSGTLAGTVKAIILFVLFPAIFYFILALSKKIFANETWKSGLTQFVLTLLPITASMHLVKAILKTTSRIPYWNYVFSDIKGIDTASDIMQNKEMLQSNLLTELSPLISFLVVLLPILGLILSLFVVKKQIHKNVLSRIITVLAVIIYSGIFIITMIEWRIK